jgi:outer membrane receptor protein involved in Fe transport
MITKLKGLTVLAGALLTSITLSAQDAEKIKEQNPKYLISGNIKDIEGKSVPYAAVALFLAADSSLIAGTASDDEGRFTLMTESGNYYLRLSFLSFEERTISGVNVDSENLNLGNITMSPGAIALKTVDISGEKSHMQLQLDKRVFNIGKDLSSKGSNAAEILDNVPSVTVDIDGNVSLRGSQNVRILIDGKPSGMVGISNRDALRQLQGNMIESIEIITNPSARYDAEGEVGIINIILKKEKRQGVNGSFEAVAGHPDHYSASYSINFRQNKLNLFSSYGISYRSSPGHGVSTQRFTMPDSVFHFERLRDHTRGGLSHNFRIGTDYYFNDKNSITASGLYKYSNGDNDVNVVYKDYDRYNVLYQTISRFENEDEQQYDYELSLNYKKTYAQKGRSWSSDFKISLSDDTEESLINETGHPVKADLKQRAMNTEDENNLLFQTDYVYPIGKNGKFEAGAKSTGRSISNRYQVDQRSSDDTWAVLPGFNNHFRFKEVITAAYLMAGNKKGKFSYQGGLRAEYSDISTELVTSGYKKQRSYTDFFPSTHFSYQFDSSNTVQLSYSRRLSRPGFRSLIPFFSYSDSRNIYGGNPDIDPEYTNSIEAGHLYSLKMGSVLSSIYYRHRTGVIERINRVDSSGYTSMFPINLSTQNAYGIEFNANYEIRKWWRTSGNLNFYRALTEGEYNGRELTSDNTSFGARASSRITIKKKIDLQLSGHYHGPQNTTQGTSKAMYAMDSGISRDILKGKGTVTFSVRDVFNSRKWSSEFITEGYHSTSEFQWRTRQFLLSFNYRLNQLKKPGRRGESFEEGESMGF